MSDSSKTALVKWMASALKALGKEELRVEVVENGGTHIRVAAVWQEIGHVHACVTGAVCYIVDFCNHIEPR